MNSKAKKKIKIIDLSTPFDFSWSVPHPPMCNAFHDMHFIYTRPRDGYYETAITLTTHSGTHLDAPMHRFNRDEKDGIYYLEDWPLDNYYGETVCLEMPKGELEPIGAKDFEKASKEIEIKEDDIVLVHTGWGKYMEKEPRNNLYLFLKRPGLEVDGVEWLLKRKVKAYGQDTIGTQHPKYQFPQCEKEWLTGAPYNLEPVHDLALSNDLMFIEHLTNLDKVAGKRFTGSFFPLPIKGVDGSPIRAIAIIEEEE